MQSFSMSCDSSISHSCFHKHVRLQYFVHNLNYKIQSKNPCHHLQAAVHTLNSGLQFRFEGFVRRKSPGAFLHTPLDTVGGSSPVLIFIAVIILFHKP